ncbi:AGE family epimerase/isomerase [Demequina sp.]|uniref:AGE family epimerase/isomerase n=1 Tax=Demequina sp. TaxID=2050685 RepID=UPI0025C35636|nr:AGE family epimerase/isomerase [Demequina sp.]
MNLLEDPAHRAWLEAEAERLLAFGRPSRSAIGGFGWLDNHGVVDPSHPIELWISARMTHSYALSVLRGNAADAALVDHGITSLWGPLRDDAHDGWFASIGPDGPINDAKEAYGHAFVILGASSAVAAGRPEAPALLEEALDVFDAHFWDDEHGLARESYEADWSGLSEYRGVNANMHTVEAYLAAADVAVRPDLLERALRITTRVVDEWARNNGWRIPEHFTAEWEPLLEYHRDEPAHPFRPFGATIGHLFEWSRLTLQLEASLLRAGLDAPRWMVGAARELYDAAVRDGWNVDGAPGFVYTVDWNGAPVVRARMHWVTAEAIGAALTLWLREGDEVTAADYESWWDYATEYHLDRDGGSWWHELAADNTVGHSTWEGKPDVYHALQATLFPRLPITPSLASAIKAGLLQ